MNEKAKNLFKSLNYTVTANFLVLGISIILNLVVPKYLGVADYGYWQLYVFYSSYVGFFHFGWIDGIYLKIGGEEYDNLDKKSLGTQLKYLFIFEIFLAIVFCIFSLLKTSDGNRQIIWLATASMLIVANIKSFALYILQSTNRIKEYAQLSRNDRYLYLVGAVGYLILGGRNPFFLIWLDVLSRFIITIWGLTRINDIVTAKKNEFSITIREIKDNIKIGSNLMLGNIASMLILGVSRFFVERQWNIETFSKLSFALSISNMFMLFINAVSVVLYPLLRRTDSDKLPELYVKVRMLFEPLTIVMLLFFYPVRMILEWWLPEYKESLYFMGFLFPMIVYEGRVSLLINTYLKTIRKERMILISNSFTLIIALITSYISVFILKSINLAVISILCSLAFRSIFSEKMLAREINVRLNRKISIELFLVFIFVLSNQLVSLEWSFLVYPFFVILYLVWNFKEIKESVLYFKEKFFMKN